MMQNFLHVSRGRLVRFGPIFGLTLAGNSGIVHAASFQWVTLSGTTKARHLYDAGPSTDL